MSPSPPRSLADELRSWSDDALADLLLSRPDLAAPVPPDLGALAVSAASRLSVQRAVDGLGAGNLQVLEVLAALPEPASSTQVGKAWGHSAKEPLEQLRALALVWGSSRSLRLVRAARDVVGPFPAGLGPPLAEALGRRSPRRLAEVMEDLGLAPAADPEQALAQLSASLGDPGTVNTLLEQAPAAARTVLDRLTWGPPIGKLDDADRPVRAEQAGSPIEWLLARGLLAVADAGHVVLPREIGLALRGGRVHPQRDLNPPPLALRERPAEQIDSGSGQAASEAIRLVDELGQAWTALPPMVLRTGGLGVRELRRTATALDVDERTAALVAEVAFSAGLIANDAEADPVWLPTPAYDGWRVASAGERWAQLVTAWLDSTRAAGLVGSRGPKDTPVAALGPDAERAQAALVRSQVLAELSSTTQALADADGASILARLDWAAPRRAGRTRTDLVSWTLREAAWLGVTGLGALCGPARLLLSGDQAAAAKALDAVLPAAVDHILLQADLTAVAPGRLEPGVERQLGEMADVESRGGATVYRFTAETVRRALDAGRTAEELGTWLGQHSRTPVPQPLSYLLTDSARRHGRLRVGTASAYLRAEDESSLAELLADRRTATLRLRRLAPTVLAAQAPPDVVLRVLREMGLSPAAESTEGDLMIRRPAARRARGAGIDRTPRRAQPPAPARIDLLAAVRTMRALDDHARHPRRTVPDGEGPSLEPMDTARALAVIREAVAARQDVWIGYLEDAGKPVRRIVEPLSVEAGRVRALERSSGKVRNYSVHRVIAVASAGNPNGTGGNGSRDGDRGEQEADR